MARRQNPSGSAGVVWRERDLRRAHDAGPSTSGQCQCCRPSGQRRGHQGSGLTGRRWERSRRRLFWRSPPAKARLSQPHSSRRVGPARHGGSRRRFASPLADRSGWPTLRISAAAASSPPRKSGTRHFTVPRPFVTRSHHSARHRAVRDDRIGRHKLLDCPFHLPRSRAEDSASGRTQ